MKSNSSPKPSSRSSTRKVDPIFVLPSAAPISCPPNTQTQTVTVTSVSVVQAAAAAVTVTVTSYVDAGAVLEPASLLEPALPGLSAATTS